MQLLSLSCTVSILVVDDIHMVVMGLLLIFGERCLGLSFFYATFVSYYYRWQTPLCCELCVLHCQSLLHIIVAGFDVAVSYAICTVGDASHLLYPCNLSVDAILIVFDKQF